MDWIAQRQADAVARVQAELAKPLPQDDQDVGDDVFDPWEIFPCLYGSYSMAFDDMALLVLGNIRLAAQERWDEQNWSEETLAHEMFREILCNADLCDYGASPRTCFATLAFREVLPELIDKWVAWSRVHWGIPA